jgi:2-polyprenyl-3-methyl-5-hydroxy-6-metoxy-1,4-benzoquinol methylase
VKSRDAEIKIRRNCNDGLSYKAFQLMKNPVNSAFSCLKCKAHSLQFERTTAHETLPSGGVLVCQQCSSTYQVKEGVPRFIPDESYAGSFGFQWNKFRRTQLDSHTKMPLSADRLFRVTQWSRDLAGQRLLEAGSGAGRFSEVLLDTGATVFSFDISNAVEANFKNNGNSPNFILFQASIYDIPLERGSFDKVVCLGVLQHTPDPERSFRELVSFVKPGGEIAIDVYAGSWLTLLSWKYFLRPITTRMPQETLFRAVEVAVKWLLKPAIWGRKVGGRIGARFFPILQYSHWGLPPDLNRDWAILDTFDMYSPAHDHPKTIPEVRRWFESAGLTDIYVGRGPNGVIARGRKPQ